LRTEPMLIYFWPEMASGIRSWSIDIKSLDTLYTNVCMSNVHNLETCHIRTDCGTFWATEQNYKKLEYQILTDI